MYKPRRIQRMFDQAKRQSTMTTTPDRMQAFLRAEYPELVGKAIPVDELATLIRTSFLAPFSAVAQKYDRLTAKDLDHPASCTYNDQRIRWSADSVDTSHIKTKDELMIWYQLRGCVEDVDRKTFGAVHAAAGCTIDLKQHQGQCPCGAGANRMSAHVTITFAGITVAREYALVAP